MFHPLLGRTRSRTHACWTRSDNDDVVFGSHRRSPKFGCWHQPGVRPWELLREALPVTIF